MNKPLLYVIIPAFNEALSIGKVIADIPKELIQAVIVCDNGSTDQTRKVAENAGAIVVTETKKGYGSACLKGMEYLRRLPAAEQPDIIVFLDGDYSDYPEELPLVAGPILEGNQDMVIGSRVLGQAAKGALQPQQVFGNWLATRLIRLFWGYRFTDLGPFRAIRWDCLEALNMLDPNYGWTVEMQVKAAIMGLRCSEVPVSYRPRIGQSKVSGTISGSILAGHKILWTIFKFAGTRKKLN